MNQTLLFKQQIVLVKNREQEETDKSDKSTQEEIKQGRK
jgi:hypothetical protein